MNMAHANMRDTSTDYLDLVNDAPTPSDQNCYLLHSIAASLIRIGDLLEKGQETQAADSEQAFNAELYKVTP